MAENKNNAASPKDNVDVNQLVNQLFNEIMSGQSDILPPGSMAYNIKIKIEGNAISVSGIPTEKDVASHKIDAKEREPLIDLIDKKSEVTIIAELPGASKESINLISDAQHIEISAKASMGEYKKKIHIASNVDPKRAKASYRNGVLEVSIKKSDKYKGKAVKIEVV